MTFAKLDELNPAQRQAAEHTDGALLIVAGAGAGKTKTLTYRIANLIHNGVLPHQILAITFTNKAAKELQERLDVLLSSTDSQTRPTASTFHSLGVRILRQHGPKIGIPSNFVIMDRRDSESLVKEINKELGFDNKQWSPGKTVNYIGNRRQGRAATIEQLETIRNRYNSLKKERDLVDFDDLIYRTVDLLQESDAAREALQNLWTHVHVDEYQDTNRIQYELVKLLSLNHGNVCAVGDTDQTIYTWRGAEIKNLLQFEKDFSNTTTVLLEQNYRSTQKIIAVANDCITKNSTRIEKNLFTKNNEGENIDIFIGSDENDEARQIAREVKSLLANNVPASEIAILYRANYQSQALEKAFISAGVQYDLLGTKFYSRSEIKTMISYLRYAINPNNPGDLARIAGSPKRGVGPKTLQAIINGTVDELGPASRTKANKFITELDEIRDFVKNNAPAQSIEFILERTGWAESLRNDTNSNYRGDKSEGEERLENLAELINVASEYDHFEAGTGLEKMLEDSALMSEQDSMDEVPRVRMMTIHASKGLEFNHVFITGLEEGLFPSDRSESIREQEEERRLFYVALTRARKKLYLTYATMRRSFGSYSFNTPSKFLTEIDPQYLNQPDSPFSSSIGDSNRARRGGMGLLDDIEF